jgi:ABC-type lipoprotein export system ATPase subunit/energy-coupling factor transporter ATP-binding protein EcfA2
MATGGALTGADEDMVARVMAAAEQETTLDDNARFRLLWALTGDDDTQPDGPRPEAGVSPERPADTETKAPAGAYLKAVTVAGFRGIGPEARLDLHPGPGVVVVAGRNGSGKSTFSEAVEVALTRTSYRWEAKKGAGDWRAGWRNLHVSEPCRIRVELAEESVGTTTVAADLETATKEPRDGMFWVQQSGRPRDRTADPLGWAQPLELYRPLLSYDELGGILDARPSELYEKLSTILGLGRIADAQERLDTAVKELSAPRREAKTLVIGLREALAASQDPRAAEATELLRRRSPDITALGQLATGTSEPPSGDLAILRELAALTVPSTEQAEAVVAEYEDALRSLAELSGEATQSLARRSVMLKHAIDHVQTSGSQQCPVCGVGTLDDAWTERARQDLAELDEQAGALRTAKVAYDAARQRLGSLVPPAPRSLEAPMDDDIAGRADAAAAWRAARDVDHTRPDGPGRLLDAVSVFAPLVAKLREAAQAERLRREDLWTPLARQIAVAVDALVRAEDADRRAVPVRAAQAWLKDHANELRNERLRPVSDRARTIWAALRQDSNVDLGEIELEGSKTRRRVAVTASVDGKEAGALTVMSQGELHALALALFLPRATMGDSPFRFVLVDDPVQAMDPAKVDGLARVLERIGENRQVIVFTHDDRLPEAIRRLGIEARILLVDRRKGSQVDVMVDSDPSKRYLADALAVAQDVRAGELLRRRAIPVLCRMAVESACKDLFMARRYGRGESRVAVEAEWEQVRSTRERVGLALRDHAKADINGWLAARPARSPALTVTGTAAHEGLRRDPLGAVRDVERLITDIRADAR